MDGIGEQSRRRRGSRAEPFVARHSVVARLVCQPQLPAPLSAPLQPPVPPPARSQPSASPPHSSTLSAAPLAPHHSTAAANLVHVFMHLFKYLLSKEHRSKASSSPCNCDTFPNGLGAARPVAGAPVSPPSISRLLHSTPYSAAL